MTPMPRLTLTGAVLDAPDPGELAAFYAELLGWVVVADEPDRVKLAAPEGGPGLAFHREWDYVRPSWPAAPGAQQMMSHLDVETDDLAAGVARAVELGATLAESQFEDDVQVCLDPAGHPFCLWVRT